jgi:hypothetical protein
MWIGILSMVMQAIFLIIGKWNYTVLTGNLLSGGISILNFFLMALTVQSAVNKEEKDAKSTMKASQALRTLMMFVVIVIGVVLPWFSTWTTIIPIFFPRIAMIFRAFANKNK